jgi:hypothetical protein
VLESLDSLGGAKDIDLDLFLKAFGRERYGCLVRDGVYAGIVVEVSILPEGLRRLVIWVANEVIDFMEEVSHSRMCKFFP